MTLCKLFAILFTFNVAALNAQSTTTTDSSSATDNTISQQEPMDKPGKKLFASHNNIMYICLMLCYKISWLTQG